MNKSELQQQVNKLSRLANKRLRHIEDAGLEQASNAYRYVQRLERDKVNYTGRTSTGKIKFDTASDNKNKSYNQLQQEFAELNRFLYESKTSTVSGTKKHYKKSFETFKQNNPEAKNISFKKWSDTMRAINFNRLVEMFGSDISVQVFDKKSALGQLSDSEINTLLNQSGADTSYEDFLTMIDELKAIET